MQKKNIWNTAVIVLIMLYLLVPLIVSVIYSV